MGFENLRQSYGNFGRALVSAPVHLLARELIAPDRIPIDYTSPIQTESYSLITWVDQRNTTESFILPSASVATLERVLREAFLPNRKFIKAVFPFAHEYMGNPEIVDRLYEYKQAVHERPGTDMYEGVRNEARRELTKTLLHLLAARLHLYHRPAQRKTSPELDALFKELDQKQIPRIRQAHEENITYWF